MELDSDTVARNMTTKRLHAASGELMYHLDIFGDHIAAREGYKAHSGMDAVHFYLVQTYRWPPAQVRAMNGDDLIFVLSEEMHGWTLPAEARV